MISKSTLAGNLQYLRRTKKLTQSEIASKIGVGVKKYRAWEHSDDEHWPSTPELFALSGIFNESPDSMCQSLIKTRLEKNFEKKVNGIIEKIKTDRLFMSFCHLASAKHPEVLDAWMTLFETEYLIEKTNYSE